MNQTNIANQRLHFIDMARSIAILLMLEGHFIEHSYKNFSYMVGLVRENGTSGSVIFDWFYFMKGFTAPMFFTVTGVVFVYLLSKNNESGFFRNRRVKRGFRRVLELLFWGYALQLSLRYAWKYFDGTFGEWLYAFHVLQSIGIGIGVSLLIYGLWKLVKIGPLFLYYFVFATVLFSFYPYFKAMPDTVFFPENAHPIIQNLFHGPSSVFPIVPWLAFTLYGGMIGAMLFRFQEHVKKLWFPFAFLIVGVGLNFLGYNGFKAIDHFFADIGLIENLNFRENAWLYGRFGQVLGVLSILMMVEKFFPIKNSLFLRIGQNTLPIYVIHVMILYNGLFGFGLSHILKDALTGWQSVLGAVGFITLFVLFIYFFTPIITAWAKLKTGVWKQVGKIFSKANSVS